MKGCRKRILPFKHLKMTILVISIGTRGDMEPFVAIGELLKEKGNRVICAFPEQFRRLAEDSDLEFASLGTSYIDMLKSETGKAAFGGSGSGLRKMLAYAKLTRKSTKINKELCHKQYEIAERVNPGRIVYNGKATYPVIWGLKNKGQHILVSPVPYVHYVKNHSHVAFHGDFGPFLNKLTYALADFGMATTVMIRDLSGLLHMTRSFYISSRKFLMTGFFKGCTG
jgi:sterol 3beta-glucosyltransferase